MYTGSTTGSKFNNDESCDDVSGITWQVDRHCQLISASSFDKMCADIKARQGAKVCNGDGCCFPDSEPHGARHVVC